MKPPPPPPPPSLHYSNKLTLLSFSLLTPPKLASHSSSSSTLTHPQCRRENSYHHHHQHQRHRHVKNEKGVFIVGPTGSGKSRLSIDLATGFFPSEVINADKIQLYKGLNITTNKIPISDRRGVVHHLLGDVDNEMSPTEYRSSAAKAITEITSRQKLPLVVGGSNSFIYALASSLFDPDSDVFREVKPDPVCTELRYDCCFLWVDVAEPVLNRYLKKRVDDMLDSGMFGELAEYFNSDVSNSVSQTGLRKAIGVPEFEGYFRKFPVGNPEDDLVRREVYQKAVREIKENTCQLAKRQVGKIMRLRKAGWDLKRLDATEVFEAAMGSGGSESIWERTVLEPSVKIVKQFLKERSRWMVPSIPFCSMKRLGPLLSIAK